jgi:DNA helicase INO80
VVSPASTLPNWADELARFAPGLRLLPYWGASAERAALRKAFDPRRLGKPDAPFHVLVTSYQLLVSDERHFRRVKWRYMVLDEAQAIKSASSARWKTLLSFACRNRLLLTGTPVQNTMAELWALLHFIMPTLFDSHEQFATWFSRGVEGAVNDGGALNAHQLSRLHAILKPFMLRRVKTEVEAEMAPKTEVMVPCALSARQRALYAAVKDKISIADLLSGGALSEKKTLHLMNIVIQLRKVCNHPELFERRAPRAALRFAPPPPEHSCASTAAAAAATAAATTGPASAPMGAAAPAERLRAPGLAAAEVCLRIPVLLFRDGMRALPAHASGAARSGGAALADAGAMLSIWHAAVIHAGWRGAPAGTLAALSLDAVSERSGGTAWAFTRLVDASPAEAARLGGAACDALGRWVEHRLGRRAAGAAAAFWAREGTASALLSRRHRPLARAALLLPERLRSLRGLSAAPHAPPLLTPLATRLLRAADSLRLARCFLPAATAPPPALRCADPAVAAQQAALDADPWARWLLHAAGERVPPPAACAGAPAVARRATEHGPMHPAAALAALRWPLRPLLAPLRAALSAELRIQAYALAHALADSGKLQALDRLLRRLSQEGHKVLIFSQMTKMLNLLEDYCRYRKWRFLRLDGSSSIAERREMVSAFQSPGDTHFVFLLSTRAGGLGINLTAADTVIFYESDWNPTMDAQAMDRAHRLGQTRPVTVYRLVCAGSVEERIVRRAQQKQAVQALVMSGAPLPEGLDAGGASDDVFAPEEVVSLLLDDAEVEAQLATRVAPKSHRAPAWGGGRRALRMDGDGVATVAEAGGEDDDELAGGAAPAKRKAPAKPRVPRAPQAPKATGLFGTKLPQPPPMPPPVPPPLAAPVAKPAAAEPPPLAEPPAKRPKVEPPPAPPAAPQPVVMAPPAPPPPPPAPVPAEAEAAPPPSLFKIKFKVKFTAPPPEDEDA